VPVRVRLSDGQGWLVSARGAALSYRIGPAARVEAGTDAALLPAGVTQVRAGDATPVTLSWRPGRAPAPVHCGPGPVSRMERAYLLSSAAFFSTSSMPPQRKNACSGRWS
jgi:hypothetical protein